MMNRTEHLAFCKERALEYLPGDPQQAFNSMMSDLGKHNETRTHIAINIGMGLLIIGELSTPDQMRKFIVGFN